MTNSTRPLSPAEQIAFWADKLRDLSAAGLLFENNAYDKKRYETIQDMAIEMLAYATARSLESLSPLKATIFSRMSPIVAGAAAVIDREGKILLMRRADNSLWAMPGGQMEVGESPAEAAVRETYEETGIRCVAKALVGVYDSRRWDTGMLHHVYKFTFLCELQEGQSYEPFDPLETLEIGWFTREGLPAEVLQPGHYKRISDAYEVRDRNVPAYFD